LFLISTFGTSHWLGFILGISFDMGLACKKHLWNYSNLRTMSRKGLIHLVEIVINTGLMAYDRFKGFALTRGPYFGSIWSFPLGYPSTNTFVATRPTTRPLPPAFGSLLKE
jgi:hypothetical protein